MRSEPVIRPASPADWPAIAGLLAAAHLPLDGAQEHLEHFACAWQGDRLVGVAGLERYGDVALLRSVAASGSGEETGRSLACQASSRGESQAQKSESAMPAITSTT